MPILNRLSGTAAPVFIDAMAAGKAAPLAVDRGLLRLMASAGITAPADVDKLSEQQLARMLENKTPGERIAIKHQVLANGVYPRTLPVARPL